jgi:hypothetical protein
MAKLTHSDYRWQFRIEVSASSDGRSTPSPGTSGFEFKMRCGQAHESDHVVDEIHKYPPEYPYRFGHPPCPSGRAPVV